MIDIFKKNPNYLTSLDLNILNTSHQIELLLLKPELLNRIKLKFTGKEIVRIAKTHPNLIVKFNLYYLDDEDVCWVLLFNPELVDRLDLLSLPQWRINFLIKEQPCLREKLNDRYKNADFSKYLYKSVLRNR